MKDNPHQYKTIPLGHFLNYKSTASLSPQFTLQSHNGYNLQVTHFHVFHLKSILSFNIILKKNILPTASHDLLSPGDVIIQWTEIYPSLKFADLCVRDKW